MSFSKSIIVSCLIGASLAQRVLLTKQWTEEPVTTIQKHMHHLRQEYKDQYQETLTNTDDMSYMGTAFVGTPLQGDDLQLYTYDTGSGWLTIMRVDCDDCSDHVYNPVISQTSEACTNSLYKDQSELNYGSAMLRGTVMSDQACLVKNNDSTETCNLEFCFFAIMSETGLNNAGILGLGPPYSQNGPSFFGDLVKEKGADGYEPIISWHLVNSPADSWVDFGSYDETYATGNLTPHQITDQSSYWQLNLQGFKLGDTNIYTGTNNCIVDTGTSYLLLTKTTYDQFKTRLEVNGFYCAGSNCLAIGTSCEDAKNGLEDLNITIDDMVYIIPPMGYLDMKADSCAAMVGYLPDNQDMYVLGDTFIRNFYPIFNYEDYTVTLATCQDCLGLAMANPPEASYTIE